MDYKALTDKYGDSLQKAVVALLVIVSGVLLAQLTWLLMLPPPSVSAAKIVASTNEAQDNQHWVEIGQKIIQRPFFGEYVVPSNETPITVDAPETNLNLKLLAILSMNEGNGFAVISQRSGSGKVFVVGDDVYGQATLANVYPDRIIIDRQGKKETLRYELQTSTLVIDVSENTPTDPRDAPQTLAQALDNATQNVASGGDVQSEVRGVLAFVAQRANDDPENFIRELGLEISNEGYQVTRNARQLQMVGLRPGDIVTAVNDSPVGNIQTDQALLNQVLQTGGELKIQVKRGSRSFTIYQTIPTY